MWTMEREKCSAPFQKGQKMSTILTAEELHDISCRQIMIAVHMNKFLVTSIQAGVHFSEYEMNMVFAQGKSVIGKINEQTAVMMKMIEKANKKKHSLKMIFWGDEKEVDRIMHNAYYILSQLTEISFALKDILAKFQKVLAKEYIDWEDEEKKVLEKRELADQIAACTELVKQCALAGKKLYAREAWS